MRSCVNFNEVDVSLETRVISLTTEKSHTSPVSFSCNWEELLCMPQTFFPLLLKISVPLEITELHYSFRKALSNGVCEGHFSRCFGACLI